MMPTFKIKGKVNEKVSGTAFVPFVRGDNGDHPVLVTARHVLESIEGEKAQVFMRKKRENGSCQKVLCDISIRDVVSPIWVSHPDVSIDIACVYMELPADVETGHIALDEVGG